VNPPNLMVVHNSESTEPERANRSGFSPRPDVRSGNNDPRSPNGEPSTSTAYRA